MSRARILADYVSSGDELAVTTATADAALPKAGGAMTGAITTNSTFDGIDVGTDVAANTAKTGITSGQASAITANTAKVTNSTNASDLASGTIADARMPNLTGAITTVEGAVATSITDDAITGGKLANDIAISTTGNIATTSSGTITSAGLVTAPSLVLTPGSAPATTEGAIYYDSTSDKVNVWNGTAWEQISNLIGFEAKASGGHITDYSIGSTNYVVHTFTSSGVFTPTSTFNVDYLVVAGGGGGGGYG